MDFKLKLEVFDEINTKIPHIGNIYPSGKYPTEAFWFAGGILMLPWLLKDYLDFDVLTVTGTTLRENLKAMKEDGFFERNEGYLFNYNLKMEEVIKPVEDTEDHIGNARVFDSEEE